MISRQILILGVYRQTLIVVRSLARAGYSIILGKEEGTSSTYEHSRHSSVIWEHPHITKDEDAFLRKLREFLRDNPGVTLVFPVADIQISCLYRNRAAMKDLARIIMPDPEILKICLSKRETYDLARSEGIPFADTEYAADLDGVKAAAGKIGYPVVVKPDTPLRPFPGKAVIARGPGDIERELAVWPRDNDFLIVQSYRPGLRHNCHFAARRGELFAYFEHKVLRTDCRDNTGLGVENVTVRPNSVLLGYTKALLGALRYSGVGCAQYLFEPESGSAALLEINPRLDANCAIPYRYGVDLPLLAVECIQNETIQPMEIIPDYPAGKMHYWMTRDVDVLLEEIREDAAGRRYAWERARHIIRCLLSADGHITWSASDPVPAISYYTSRAARFLSKALHAYGTRPKEGIRKK